MGNKLRYYAVIDTNVIVSAMLKKSSLPDRVIQEIFRGTITPLLNREILDEYWNVLQRPKFKFPEKAVNTLVTGLIKRAFFVAAEPIKETLPDSKDVVFLQIFIQAVVWKRCKMAEGAGCI